MKMNMNKLMQQVQETQKKIQDELTRMRVTGSAGGGMVEVTLDGTKQMVAIKIDPQAVTPGRCRNDARSDCCCLQRSIS